MTQTNRQFVCAQRPEEKPDRDTFPAPGRCPNSSPRVCTKGFLVGDYAPCFERATQRLREWIANGDTTHRESVVEDFQQAPDGFLGLFEDENIGKQVIEVADPSE